MRVVGANGNGGLRRELPRLRRKDLRRRCDGKARQAVAQGKSNAAKDEKAKASILLADGGASVPEAARKAIEDMRRVSGRGEREWQITAASR